MPHSRAPLPGRALRCRRDIDYIYDFAMMLLKKREKSIFIGIVIFFFHCRYFSPALRRDDTKAVHL